MATLPSIQPLLDLASKKRLNLYERHMWEEILQWEHDNKESMWNYYTTITTNAIKSAIQSTGSVIPEKITDNIKAAIETALRTCLSGSLYTTSKTQVVGRANELFKSEISDISQLKELGLEQLDELANSYSSTNQIFATLEGAGMGLGGALFIAADIPALIMINLRLLVQLAYIYGIDANDPRERQYILDVMTIASAEQKDRHDIFCRLDQQAKINAQLVITAIQIEENIANEVMKRAVGAAHRIALRLSHAKLFQLLPLIGLAIGAGSNFMYTREITTYGMMMFRKRWLMEKHSMFDDVLKYREMKDEKLLTSWIFVSEGDAYDEPEFEEDFRADLLQPKPTTEIIENKIKNNENTKENFQPSPQLQRPSSPLYPSLEQTTTNDVSDTNNAGLQYANYYKALLRSNNNTFATSPPNPTTNNTYSSTNTNPTTKNTYTNPNPATNTYANPSTNTNSNANRNNQRNENRTRYAEDHAYSIE